MTKDEALNIAIDYMNERLEEHDAKFQRHPVAEAERNNILADIKAVKEALAQPEQEPVALETVYETIIQWDEGGGKRSRRELARRIVSLYTTPPQRKPLTDEEIILIVAECAASHQHTDIHFARAIERAHGIKELV